MHIENERIRQAEQLWRKMQQDGTNERWENFSASNAYSPLHFFLNASMHIGGASWTPEALRQVLFLGPQFFFSCKSNYRLVIFVKSLFIAGSGIGGIPVCLTRLAMKVALVHILESDERINRYKMVLYHSTLSKLSNYIEWLQKVRIWVAQNSCSTKSGSVCVLCGNAVFHFVDTRFHLHFISIQLK